MQNILVIILYAFILASPPPPNETTPLEITLPKFLNHNIPK